MSTIVEVETGKLEGLRENALRVFRGIPFARPPVGDLRFRPPLPPESWTGVRNATRFGPRSLQAPSPGLQAVLGGAPVDLPPADEDCLYLNVWTPEAAANLPVMVWIHGGAFVHGSGSDMIYDGSALASRSVVVVTINYRLGALGFLSLPDSASSEDDFVTNFGLLDQVAALRWVQRNIERFGGDPENVTIFGESAGAMSVDALLASPVAAGLFRKAISQSGPATHAVTLAQAAKTADTLFGFLGLECPSASVLRAVPASDMLDAQAKLLAQSALGGGDNTDPVGLRFLPVVDGRFLKSVPVTAVREGVAKDIPLLVGSTRDEWNLFAAIVPATRDLTEPALTALLDRMLAVEGAPPRAADILEAYRRASVDGVTFLELFGIAQTDRMFRVPADRLAEAQSAHQRQVFAYRVDWPSPLGGGVLGACHAIDVPLVFGTHRTAERFVGEGPGVDALAKTVGDAWVAFARTGDPSTSSLAWQPFDAERRPTMLLDATCRTVEAPREAERRAWDGIII